jgi:fructose-bisphosphate aldolase, class I
MHTQGLDDLEKRAAAFYARGARFTKWRCALKVGNNLPSELAINLMAVTLARYASICQANGLMPIIEPEVLVDGDHDIQACQDATFRANSALFKACQDHHVFLEGTLLKPNMVTPGTDHPSRIGFSNQEIAARTVITFLRTVPPALPGIVVSINQPTFIIKFIIVFEWRSKRD